MSCLCTEKLGKQLSVEKETNEILKNQLIKCEIKRREYTEKFLTKEAEAKQLSDDLATANEKIKILSDQGSWGQHHAYCKKVKVIIVQKFSN